MRSSDRAEFDSQMALLTAGFSSPDTNERRNAYWDALGSLQITQFARIVQHALSAEYAQHTDARRPATVPTVAQLWQIDALLKGRAEKRAPATALSDSLSLFANRLLLIHMGARNGLGSTDGKPSLEFSGCLKARDELVDEFSAYIRARDELATPREFLRRWVARIKLLGVIHEDALAKYRAMAMSADGRAPFPLSYVEGAASDA